MSFITRNLAETQGTTQPPNPKVGDRNIIERGEFDDTDGHYCC